jgi:hypothetical protein
MTTCCHAIDRTPANCCTTTVAAVPLVQCLCPAMTPCMRRPCYCFAAQVGSMSPQHHTHDCKALPRYCNTFSCALEDEPPVADLQAQQPVTEYVCKKKKEKTYQIEGRRSTPVPYWLTLQNPPQRACTGRPLVFARLETRCSPSRLRSHTAQPIRRSLQGAAQR